MPWLYFAIITAYVYGLFDFFLKKAAGKIDDGLAALIINSISAVVIVIYLILSRTKLSNLLLTKDGLTFSIVAGIMIGLASITFIKVFSTGANIVVGVSIVRIGMIVVASLLGILFLQEKLDLKQIAGFVLALSGLFLILTK